MTLKDADELIWPAVKTTLDALKLADEDAAAAKLAQRLAQNIDAMTDQVYAMRWLVPELLKVLAELGATPAARAAIKTQAKSGGAPASAQTSRLDQLRQSKASRRA